MALEFRTNTLFLLDLCNEVLLHILSFLDLPDLFSCSRTCHRLRPLVCDPILHRNRLVIASIRLSFSLPNRPTLSSLRPPTGTIYLTPTMVAARKIGRSLISIKLSRNLGRRPNVGSLVEHNILPEECVVLVAGKGRDGRGGGYVSPRLVGVKRRLERESVKDGLRGWLSGKRRQELERREMEEVERSVTTLVRRFAGKAKERERERERARDKKERERWGRAAIAEEKRRTGAPTRAHVLGLRRFWESIGKASAT